MGARSTAVDRRLLDYTRGTRRYLIARISLGGVTAALVVGQAGLIALVISRVIDDGASAGRVGVLLAGLLAVIFGRAGVNWLGDRLADRASSAAKSDLRAALTEQIGALGPAGIDRRRSGSLVVLTTSGIDALDSYFARYLPQLVLAAHRSR